MSGTDLEFLEYWHFWGDRCHLERNKPIRLRDREAFRSLLASLQRFSKNASLTLTVDDVEYDPSLTFDELIDLIPPHVSVVHLQADGADHIVHFDSLRGGTTWVASSVIEEFYGSSIQHLAAMIESTSRPLGVWRHVSRLRWPKALARKRVSVVERARRDDLHSWREQRRNAWVSAVLGFLGGIAGAIVTLLAAGK